MAKGTLPPISVRFGNALSENLSNHSVVRDPSKITTYRRSTDSHEGIYRPPKFATWHRDSRGKNPLTHSKDRRSEWKEAAARWEKGDHRMQTMTFSLTRITFSEKSPECRGQNELRTWDATNIHAITKNNLCRNRRTTCRELPLRRRYF